MSSSKIDQPGIYEMPAQAYHADPCAVPSASSSLLKLMMAETPRHAWESHPRLNPNHESSDGEEKFDRGHACHTLMLNDEHRFCIIDADAYRSNAAKEARAKAYLEGKTPILKHRWPEVVAMCDAGHAQIANMQEQDERDIFKGGVAESTLVWKETIGGADVWCRARLDYRKTNADGSPRLGQIYGDYKSLDASINPNRLHKYTENADWAFQQAFYERGIRHVIGEDDPDFRFVVHEAKKPHRLIIAQLDPSIVGVAHRKVEYALRQWAWCIKNNCWPAFPNTTVRLGVSPWAEESFTAREEAEAAMLERLPGKMEIFDTMRKWQAPL